MKLSQGEKWVKLTKVAAQLWKHNKPVHKLTFHTTLKSDQNLIHNRIKPR